jgi:uncharacterized protein (TIGR03435 family)
MAGSSTRLCKKMKPKLYMLLRAALVGAAAWSGMLDGRQAEFEVASIRPDSRPSRASSTSRSGGRVELENVSLREAIEFAYGIPEGRGDELAGPAWLADEKFDIAATCPPETPRARVLEMLQTLFAQRFGLRVHREDRKVRGYALTVARHDRLPHIAAPGEENLTWGNDHLIARALSMASLADRLSGPIFQLGRPVVDVTGVAGAFDFTLSWRPEGAPGNADSAASIFTALEEQLGLKLAAREVVVSTVVVDHVERTPSGN